MSKVIFSPERILWVVKQKDMSTRGVPRGERELERWRVECERLESR